MALGFNLKEAIVEALNSLGGSATASEVKEYIRSKYGKNWKAIRKVMDDLCQESQSSFFLPQDRVLKRVGEEMYSLKEALVSYLPETETLSEELQQNASNVTDSLFKRTIALYSEKLEQILNQPIYGFAEAPSKLVPETSGVYIIHNKSLNQIIYVGRTKNLRQSLLHQHKRSNIHGSKFRKALRQKYNLKSEENISNYIDTKCSFQMIAVRNFEEAVRLENFITAIIAPILNSELRQ